MMNHVELNLDAINRFPFGVVRDYPVFPLSVTDGQIVLAVSHDLEEHLKNGGSNSFFAAKSSTESSRGRNWTRHDEPTTG